MFPLTVSQINTYLRELLEADQILSDVWVEGEVSNFKRAASGHCYFTLKDDSAALDAAMWRTYAVRLDTSLANGDAVLAHGHVSIYPTSGRLQLYVDRVRPAGTGVLHARFEELKERLQEEGLFADSRKRSLPVLPQRVGIATSAQGAALRDILTVLQRRCPLVEVLVAPCLVQGEQAAASIVRALHMLYDSTVDLVIVARGGGSIEDLWAFNEEPVARAVFASPVPIIAGVGHETDTTIVDYVADLRAPTPSAAAELAVPDMAALHQEILAMRQRLDAAVEQALLEQQRLLAASTAHLEQYHPLTHIDRTRQEVDDLLRRATDRVSQRFHLQRLHLTALSERLGTLGPLATLERGYAVVRRATDGRVVKQADQVSPGERLLLTLRHGSVIVDVRTVDLFDPTLEIGTQEGATDH